MVSQHDLDALASTIERHYVFIDVAAMIADEVRAWDAVDGEPPFDVWTTALRQHDRHLRVAPTRPEGTPREQHEERSRFLSTRVDDGVAILAVAELVDPDEPGRLAELDAALARVDRCEALVIDVRGNRGGWPTMVERIVGALFGEQEVHILDFVHRGGSERSASTPRASQRLATMPVAVLVDGGTASAAESLAYVLATTGRATIVGSTTAGAANPGDWFDTGVGMWAFVATGAPIDPRTGTGWEGGGVPIDVSTAADAAEDAALAVVRAAVASR